MKIRRIYCNDENHFHNIKFNQGFNVIQADITDRTDTKKDVHNLGKSLLIDLIDFLMLKGIPKKDKFFLTKGGFEGLEFFAELELNNGKYMIIKRIVDTPTKISFKSNEIPLDDFEINIEWDFENMAFDKAKTYLNEQLGFDIVSHWPYRKSATYFLRTQNDFRDIFRLDKFSKGTDKDWKPFMFDLLGFDGKLIAKKYELESEIEKLTNDLETLEQEANVKAGEKDRIQGLIEIKKDEKWKIERLIDNFNFYEKDKKINRELVEEIDSQIRALNTQRYSFTYEVSKIEESLKMDVPNVDVNHLKKLYDDVNLYFPKQIEKNYRDLLEFNKSITSERNKILRENLTKLNTDLVEINEIISKLEKEKRNALSLLTQKDSYSKFKVYQKQLARFEGEISSLKERQKMITRTTIIEEKRAQTLSDITQQQQLIEKEIAQVRHAEIRKVFNRLIFDILNTHGLISIKMNKAGNVDFIDEIQNPQSLKITDEAGGTSYKKLMCMAFDLSILIVYSNRSFYRFVYHDGALEAIEDRKKILFINKIREICSEYGLQYIMTLIDSDLPVDENGRVIKFSGDEICLTVHDKDDSGKLFKRSF